MKTAIGIYALVVGLGVLGLWTMLLLGGQVPELETEPASIATHMTAEGLMAVLLIASATGLFLKRRFAPHLMLLSSGMVIYSVINSSGYYLEQNNIGMVGMFALLAVLTVIAVALLRRSDAFSQSP